MGRICLAITVLLLGLVGTTTGGHAQGADTQRRVEVGLGLARSACGTAAARREDLHIQGRADGSISLRSLPSASVGRDVTFSSQEAEGFAAALQRELTAESVRLTETQIACMRSYVDRIFDVIFPRQGAAAERDFRETVERRAREMDEHVMKRVQSRGLPSTQNQYCATVLARITMTTPPHSSFSSYLVHGSGALGRQEADRAITRLEEDFYAKTRMLDGLFAEGVTAGCFR